MERKVCSVLDWNFLSPVTPHAILDLLFNSFRSELIPSSRNNDLYENVRKVSEGYFYDTVKKIEYPYTYLPSEIVSEALEYFLQDTTFCSRKVEFQLIYSFLQLLDNEM